VDIFLDIKRQQEYAKQLEDGDRRNVEDWARNQERRNEAKRRGLFQRDKPKERRIAIFQRWQKMRKASAIKLRAPDGDSRFCLCKCGRPKACAQTHCYDCQDMMFIVRHRIPMSGAVEVEKRYGRIYETPLLRHDIDYRSSRYEDSENFGSLHNVIRAMEDSLAYD
jgi:hypothetical protein